MKISNLFWLIEIINILFSLCLLWGLLYIDHEKTINIKNVEYLEQKLDSIENSYYNNTNIKVCADSISITITKI